MRREDDELDADERALIGKLRDLPPEGTEPDWDAMQAAIRAQVGERAPRPWWRNWRWIVPVWALAATAAAALLVVRGESDEAHVAPRGVDAGIEREVETPVTRAVHALWLDGEVLELDELAGAQLEALDELDTDARAALRPSDDVTGGILPVADYGWIDALDDESLDRADAWLKRNRS